MIVKRTSLFPASKETVFRKLQQAVGKRFLCAQAEEVDPTVKTGEDTLQGSEVNNERKV